eukprot:TRINITY_DN3948_c0_g1_i2.p2 TRINITY_DN3948_c0_g1~~TRINITY_DN3948_c0_g1_i2.p2  ORF type:complete len:109 (+),score=4.07 TRINITY_DN3948_c0_g1_i2:177-503(+)
MLVASTGLREGYAVVGTTGSHPKENLQQGGSTILCRLMLQCLGHTVHGWSMTMLAQYFLVSDRSGTVCNFVSSGALHYEVAEIVHKQENGPTGIAHPCDRRSPHNALG